MANRRSFLKVIGGGVILAAAGLGGWAATRDPAAARLPWAEAGQNADPVRRALSWAILGAQWRRGQHGSTRRERRRHDHAGKGW